MNKYNPNYHPINGTFANETDKTEAPRDEIVQQLEKVKEVAADVLNNIKALCDETQKMAALFATKHGPDGHEHYEGVSTETLQERGFLTAKALLSLRCAGYDAQIIDEMLDMAREETRELLESRFDSKEEAIMSTLKFGMENAAKSYPDVV